MQRQSASFSRLEISAQWLLRPMLLKKRSHRVSEDIMYTKISGLCILGSLATKAETANHLDKLAVAVLLGNDIVRDLPKGKLG